MITETAAEWLFTGVSPHVHFELRRSFETLLTEVALEIPFLAVRHFVFLQPFCAFEGLLANITRRWLLTVVNFQQFLGLEALGAVRALKWSPTCNSCHMPWDFI